jgi:hypothetical protein
MILSPYRENASKTHFQPMFTALGTVVPLFFAQVRTNQNWLVAIESGKRLRDD